MVMISINSNCNNNCKYCFQHDEYHKKNLILNYSEIIKILEWSTGSKLVGILGGEPTLHPDIVKIMNKVDSMFDNYLILTNLLCKTELLKEIINVAPKAHWLINTTSRDELKEQFRKNMDFFKTMPEFNERLNLGITLMNDEEYDNRNIENLIDLGENYNNLIMRYRLGIATPFHKGKFELLNYDKQVKHFCTLAKEKTPNIFVNFDCPINNCQISPELVTELINDYGNISSIRVSANCDGVIVVNADKSVNWCASTPESFLTFEDYKYFKNSEECYNHFQKQFKEYMIKNKRLCAKEKDCKNIYCNGPCIAITEYLRKQQET